MLGRKFGWLSAVFPLLAQPTAVVVPGLEVGTEGVDAGEVLLGQLNCVACHTASRSVRERLDPKQAPLLGEVAARARPPSLQQFIAAPHREKAGTPMPDLLHSLPDTERAATAEALTHFLASLTTPSAPEAPSSNRLQLEQGRILYHRTGCVACHAPQETAAALFPELDGGGPSDPDATRYVLTKLNQTSVPLGNLRRKYSPIGLVRFLIDPLAARPAGRMPALSLTETEARAVAAYLQREPAGAASPNGPTRPTVESRAPFKVEPVKVRRGRDLFAALGCAACHEFGGDHPRLASQLKAPPLERLNPGSATGCLSAQPGQGVPRFLFGETQSTALQSALARRDQLTQPLPAKQRVPYLLTALNCYGCHSRDGYGGPSPSRADYFVAITGADLGDEGRIPPHLGEVGNKLRPEWLHTVLTNRGLVRPYMATRMPQFGATNALPLATLFIEADLPDQAPAPAGPPDGDRALGRRLTGTGGYACISCHNFGPHQSLGISIMDMTQMAKRLRHDWFYRYLLDPPSLRPGTRMPAFWPDGKPTLPDIVEGDTARQINAIWAFLSQGAAAEPPPGLTEAEKIDQRP